MLGVRLDSAMAESLDRFAAATRRSKSEIARDAVREYLERHVPDDEYKRQVKAIAAMTNEHDLFWLDTMNEDLMSGEPDYDWGGAKA